MSFAISRNIRRASFFTFLILCAGTLSTAAQTKPDCSALPVAGRLKSVLQSVVGQGAAKNSGRAHATEPGQQQHGSGADSSSITATLPASADTGSGADVGVIDQPGTETGSGADSSSSDGLGAGRRDRERPGRRQGQRDQLRHRLWCGQRLGDVRGARPRHRHRLGVGGDHRSHDRRRGHGKRGGSISIARDLAGGSRYRIRRSTCPRWGSPAATADPGPRLPRKRRTCGRRWCCGGRRTS